MPLEISEIGVHIAVGGPGPSGSGGAGPGGGDGNNGGAGLTQAQVEAIVKSCVADTLRTLRMMQER